jgi:hypothetical protein
MAQNIYQARNVFNFLSNEESNKSSNSSTNNNMIIEYQNESKSNEESNKSSNSSTNNNMIIEYQNENESSRENDVSFFHPTQSPINNSAEDGFYDDDEFSNAINSNDRNNSSISKDISLLDCPSPIYQHSENRIVEGLIKNKSNKNTANSYYNSSSSLTPPTSGYSPRELRENYPVDKNAKRAAEWSIVEGSLIKNKSDKNTANSYYNSSSSLTPPTSGYSPREWGENHPVDKNAKRAEWSTAEKNYLIPLAESLKRINATNLFARCLKHIKNDPLATPIFHRRHVLDSDRLKSCLVTFEKHNKELELDE